MWRTLYTLHAKLDPNARKTTKGPPKATAQATTKGHRAQKHKIPTKGHRAETKIQFATYSLLTPDFLLGLS